MHHRIDTVIKRHMSAEQPDSIEYFKLHAVKLRQIAELVDRLIETAQTSVYISGDLQEGQIVSGGATPFEAQLTYGVGPEDAEDTAALINLKNLMLAKESARYLSLFVAHYHLDSLEQSGVEIPEDQSADISPLSSGIIVESSPFPTRDGSIKITKTMMLGLELYGPTQSLELDFIEDDIKTNLTIITLDGKIAFVHHSIHAKSDPLIAELSHLPVEATNFMLEIGRKFLISRDESELDQGLEDLRAALHDDVDPSTITALLSKIKSRYMAVAQVQTMHTELSPSLPSDEELKDIIVQLKALV